MENSSQHHPSQNEKQVHLFHPYCTAAPGSNNHLTSAMTMFSRGQLMGARQIKDGEPMAFSLGWQPGQLPADPCPCTLTIDATPGACYRFSVPSYQAVLWLLEVCRSRAHHSTGEQVVDLPQTFWAQMFSA